MSLKHILCSSWFWEPIVSTNWIFDDDAKVFPIADFCANLCTRQSHVFLSNTEIYFENISLFVSLIRNKMITGSSFYSCLKGHKKQFSISHDFQVTMTRIPIIHSLYYHENKFGMTTKLTIFLYQIKLFTFLAYQTHF